MLQNLRSPIVFAGMQYSLSAFMFNSPINRLRIIGLCEGVSFLVLLGIAMPLKWIWGMPMAVRIVGWAHGALFILFCFALLIAWLKADWPIKRAIKVFIAAWIPFGPFVIDKQLQEWDHEWREGVSASG